MRRCGLTLCSASACARRPGSSCVGLAAAARRAVPRRWHIDDSTLLMPVLDLGITPRCAPVRVGIAGNGP